jgi:hypothetical protein
VTTPPSLSHPLPPSLCPCARCSAATAASSGYQAFLVESRDWLLPYALFCVLRDRFGTVDQTKWPEHSTITPEVLSAGGEGAWRGRGCGVLVWCLRAQPRHACVDSLTPAPVPPRPFVPCNAQAIARLTGPEGPYSAQAAFWCFVQYHLHLQLSEVVAYGRKLHVAFKVSTLRHLCVAQGRCRAGSRPGEPLPRVPGRSVHGPPRCGAFLVVHPRSAWTAHVSVPTPACTSALRVWRFYCVPGF